MKQETKQPKENSRKTCGEEDYGDCDCDNCIYNAKDAGQTEVKGERRFKHGDTVYLNNCAWGNSPKGIIRIGEVCEVKTIRGDYNHNNIHDYFLEGKQSGYYVNDNDPRLQPVTPSLTIKEAGQERDEDWKDEAIKASCKVGITTEKLYAFVLGFENCYKWKMQQSSQTSAELSELKAENERLRSTLIKIRETLDCVINEFAFEAFTIADEAISKSKF